MRHKWFGKLYIPNLSHIKILIKSKTQWQFKHKEIKSMQFFVSLSLSIFPFSYCTLENEANRLRRISVCDAIAFVCVTFRWRDSFACAGKNIIFKKLHWQSSRFAHPLCVIVSIPIHTIPLYFFLCNKRCRRLDFLPLC